jgi:hypothetical protein
VNLSAKDKDVVISASLILLSLYMVYLSATIDIRGSFVQSAAIFPLMVSVCMTQLCIVYFIDSLRKGGRPTPDKIRSSFLSLFKESCNRRVLLAILFVGIFIFFGVTYTSFYVSGAVFMAFIILLCVRKLHFIVSIATTVVFVGLMYLVFNRLFRLPIL